MTVCVAAISNTGMIIGASDRMLSNVEVAYEPESSKIWALTNAIVAMWSGDPSTASQVLGATHQDILKWLGEDPKREWFNVRDIVDLYVEHWNQVKRARAEAALLAPLGLTLDTFIERQRSFEPGVAEKLTNALIGHALPLTSCIIAGIDHSGAHVWVVTNGVPACFDAEGFAVIGAGARHADSQMIAGRHSPRKSPSETLVLAHMAKKRAEVTPSVGGATDIMLIGPSLGQHGPLPDYHLAKLDADYEKMLAAERDAFSGAVTEFDAYLKTFDNQPEVQQEADEEGEWVEVPDDDDDLPEEEDED